MVIYIEYAFLENFLFDGTLLALSLAAAKQKLKWGRICLSACLGAVFALLFPFLRLPEILRTLFKLSVGFLLCMLVSGRLKTKKEWGRYALTSVFFFCFSFGFGGTLLGLYGRFGESAKKLPSIAVFFGFAVLSVFSIFLIRKLYARKRVFQSVYTCLVKSQTKELETLGFLDSGNLAMKNGIPVCFLSLELIYELFFEQGGGQVVDEMEISTLAGVKKIPLYKGEVIMESVRTEVYFAPSKNMIGREYKILLNATMEKGYGMD